MINSVENEADGTAIVSKKDPLRRKIDSEIKKLKNLLNSPILKEKIHTTLDEFTDQTTQIQNFIQNIVNKTRQIPFDEYKANVNKYFEFRNKAIIDGSIFDQLPVVGLVENIKPTPGMPVTEEIEEIKVVENVTTSPLTESQATSETQASNDVVAVGQNEAVTTTEETPNTASSQSSTTVSSLSTTAQTPIPKLPPEIEDLLTQMNLDPELLVTMTKGMSAEQIINTVKNWGVDENLLRELLGKSNFI